MSAPDVASVAPRLGLAVRRRRLGPCPACRADRSGSDRRPPVVFGGPRWKCTTCHATGDSINLVALVVGSHRKDYSAAFAWLKRGDIAPAFEAAPDSGAQRIPEAELRSVLRSATPIGRTTNPAVLAFVGRKFPTVDRNLIPAGVLPTSSHPVYDRLSRLDDRGPWWPRRWADTWRLVVPAFTGTGTLAGLHARAVGDASPKARWPLGGQYRGLIFADPRHARPFLQGGPPPDRLIITEGLTDFLTACAVWPNHGVIGIESGSMSALRLFAHRLGDAQVVDACDYDRAGEAYTCKVVDALAPHPVTRFLYRLAS